MGTAGRSFGFALPRCEAAGGRRVRARVLRIHPEAHPGKRLGGRAPGGSRSFELPPGGAKGGRELPRLERSQGREPAAFRATPGPTHARTASVLLGSPPNASRLEACLSA